MGYKLAGCDVIGCCEIDKRMNAVEEALKLWNKEASNE